ncbi:MAG TPA: glycoside hydrolase family 3 N-terminal domain-containing protein [Acidimicrobiia bacterium]|nr:glycoside hydrolase family 3 N-terminal domain-containing protein [Acidimicrobiia bacterium]
MTALTVDGQQPAYRDPDLPIQERVEDLLEQMTWEEKIAQLGSVWVFQLLEGGGFAPDKAKELLQNGLGHVTRVSGASNLDAEGAARVANSIQEFLVNETRLGIPAIIHEEICSGLMARGSTVFPQAIGVACTWEPDLAEAMADVVRVQMRALGAHQGLSPVLDICRDPRWGRAEETFGEDPHLVATMGVAFVRGLQGHQLTEGVLATAKHFVGYGASEGGLNWAPAHIGARELHEVYLHPFEAAVKTADLQSVMNGYHELDGVPCAADRGLMTDLLRDTWGFDGSVVSDYFSVRQLADYHHLTEDGVGAAAIALTAGVDVELPSTDCYGGPLLEAIRSGAVSHATVDSAVRKVLGAKFALGLFETPLVEPELATSVVDTPSQRGLARAIARKSLVLLRNDGVLPLDPDIPSIAVIGPNADTARNLFGDYTYPAHIESLLEMRTRENVFSIPFPDDADLEDPSPAFPTVLDALRDRWGERVRYAPGCEVQTDSRDGFDEAVAIASASDVAILVMGDKAGLTEDCTSGEGRDRSSLDLPGVQEHLIRAIVETGTPVVLVLVAGRPTASAWAHENCAAVISAWLPGQEGAAAIAEALCGDLNPGGKLAMSHPRNVGQIPVYYGHKVSGGRSHWKGDYVDGPSSPLYPFGHGLSYTSFELSEIATTNGEVGWHHTVTITATVTNTGDRDGDEVVQLYIRDPASSLTRPVLELKAFARVRLTAGQSAAIEFGLPIGQIGFYDHGFDYVVEPGQIDVLVGTSSVDLVEAGSFSVVPDPSGRPPQKVFDGTIEVRHT